MIGFQHPELALLALPAAWMLWKTRTGDRVTLVLRALAAAALVLALTAPYVETSAPGRDVVFVVDRSRSMPREAEERAAELIRLAEEARGSGDRVGVVTFGTEAVIEQLPTASGSFGGFTLDPGRDASDLHGALEVALSLVPEGRAASVLVLSDGESNGRDALPAARRAFARNVRLDVVPIARRGRADLSVDRIDLPDGVAVGEPFQFTAWVRSDRRVESDYELERGGRVLSRGRRVFERGLNRLVFRDVLEAGGVAQYEVRLLDADDRVPENNRGRGAVLATGARPVLILNGDGRAGALAQALQAAGIPVAVRTPETTPMDSVSLLSWRAVVLENVAADRIGRGLRGLEDFVRERGGGLLVTGGQASFGTGGYFLSAIDELLPVSMELRQENRKQAIAMAIVMDRSGSMGAGVAGGMTKMDLANLGASAAIGLLSPMDAATVIAVDSGPHVVVPLTPVVSPGVLASRVRQTTAGGGGIYVRNGLKAALRQLNQAEQANRHITLFADAADSEQQDGCLALVRKVQAGGVTTSVIALGTEQNKDAPFLKNLAAAGGGEAYFTTDPTDLPRLFAQDTMKVARSTFIEEAAGTRVLPDLFGLGDLSADGFPGLAGYNLTYLREGATLGVVTTDDYAAPVFAFWHQGLGRTAAFTGQVGGSFGEGLVAWPGFARFFVTVVRWLAGSGEAEDLFTTARREGRQAVIAVEVDPEAERPPDTSGLVARVRTPGGRLRELQLERVDEHRYEARYDIEEEGVSVATVRIGGDRFVTAPPIVLPYSPEFEPSLDLERGRRVLRELARESDGRVDPTASEWFAGERGGSAWRVVSRELLLAALLLLLVEIAGRRLQLWSSVGGLARAGAGYVREQLPRRAARTAPERTETSEAPEPAGASTGSAPAQEAPRGRPAEPGAAAEKGVLSALGKARREAEKRLDR